MRRVIEGSQRLSEEELTLLDNHSLLNLFNILELHLALAADEIPEAGLFKYSRFCLDVLGALSRADICKIAPDILDNCSELRQQVKRLLNEFPGSRKTLNNLLEISAVGHDRIMEFQQDRHEWRLQQTRQIEDILKIFLEATGRVSGQRFGFIFGLGSTDADAYNVLFDIQSEKDTILAPLILNDVIRDLTCNARKYSDPGTTIRVSLKELNDKSLQLVISDEGMGIPEAEIEDVVKFGYRATNVLDRKTMGGGIGLTKAYNFCRKHNGRFVIESEIGKGTTIELTLKMPS